MLFKLSLKNFKKSFKDYAIYFVTIVLGVAIFYIFNAMDSQQAMLDINSRTSDIINLLSGVISGLSFIVCIVLGFLIIYANKFLIKRRKKEFGTYMVLGMSKTDISKILILETVTIGLVSLGVGLGLGIIASQLMSVVVANMFAVDMTSFKFVFSFSALIQTIIYFGIMYLLVMIFNTITISKTKLINLLTANRQGEKVKVKNKYLSIIVFILGVGILSYAYYKVAFDWINLNQDGLLISILLGFIGSFFFFYSLSGLLIRVIKKSKTYFKNLNVFVLRQIDSMFNTAVFSMTIISVLLFFTITIFSTAVSIRDSATSRLEELVPVDFYASKNMYVIDNEYDENGEVISSTLNEESTTSISDSLEKMNLSAKPNVMFKDPIEVSLYELEELTITKTFNEEIAKKFETENSNLYFGDMPATIMTISDYNEIARRYRKKQYDLGPTEYLVVCDYKTVCDYYNSSLKMDTKISIKGEEYEPRYKETIYGFVEMSGQEINPGIIIVPNDVIKNEKEDQRIYVADFNGDDKQKEKYSNELTELAYKTRLEEGVNLNTKEDIYANSIGLGAVFTFISLYLGIVFLISSAAILALKELSEAANSKERYRVLRQLGADNAMINKALFNQIAIFFLLPLGLAIIDSIFGIKFANAIFMQFNSGNLLLPIISTAIFIIVIYGGYFLITYFTSKNIISE